MNEAQPAAAAGRAKPGLAEQFFHHFFHQALIYGFTLRATILLLVGIALADWLFWGHYGGYGFALFTLLLAAGTWGLAVRRGRPQTLQLLLILLLLAIRCAWQFSFLPGFCVFVLLPTLGVFAATPLIALLDAMFAGCFSYLMGWIILPYHGITLAKACFARWATCKGQRLRLLVTICIPAAAVLIVLFLFSVIFIAANPVIAKGWDVIYRHFQIYIDWFIDHFINIPRWFFWALMAWLIGAVVTPFCPPSLADWAGKLGERCAPRENEPDRPLMGLTATSVLVAVNLIYLVYNGIDAWYLWLKAALPSGVTWSQYSRNGAGWLTFALLLATVIIGLATSRWLAFQKRGGLLRGLSYLWVVQNLVMAAAVLRRLQLYIGYNGLTSLRITGIVGTVLVASGLLLMVVKIQRHHNLLWIVRRYIAAFAAAVILLAIFPDDLACARFNVARVMGGYDPPLSWLAEHGHDLGAEAYPSLIPLLDHPDTIVACGVRQYLGNKLETLRGRAEKPWQERDFTEARALALLTAIAPRLTGDTDLWRYRGAETTDWMRFCDYANQWRDYRSASRK